MSQLPKGIKKIRFHAVDNSQWFNFFKKRDSQNFEYCINWMLKNYKERMPFPLGQMGGGEFQLANGANDEVVVSDMTLVVSRDMKDKICMLKLTP